MSECVTGVFAFDDAEQMISSEHFPKDPTEVANRIADIQSGIPSPEHRRLIGRLVERGHTDFTLESTPIARKLQQEFRRAKFEPVMPNLAGKILREKFMEVEGDIELDIRKFAREVSFVLARHKLRLEASRRDKLIIQTIGLLDEIDKFSNILIGMVREWYSTHFPELNRLVPDHQTYLKLIVDLGSRENFSLEGIKAAVKIPHEKAEKIMEAALSSLGAQFDELDTVTIQGSAREILHMYELREQVSRYIDEVMDQVAPNLRTVVGGPIGARLISLAGGLERLSKMPASTIQVLGAEKALFRALKTRARPPKHGVIYQYPEIRGAPRSMRGKIARALAGKIAIAARIDAMSGEFIGDKLATDLKTRIASIRSKEEGRKR